MTIRKLTSVFFLLFSGIIFSQSKITVLGVVTIDKEPAEGALVELKTNKTVKYALTGKKGNYKFDEILISTQDTIVLTASFMSYEPMQKKITASKTAIEVNFHLTEKIVQNLEEVVVTGEKNVSTSAYKTSFKVNSKDFIKNSRATNVLNRIPSVSIQDDQIFVEGTLKGSVLIDGIQSNLQFLRTVQADDIDRVEVISNPSASFGADFTGAIVNIVLKQKIEHFLKGTLEGAAGIRNEYVSTAPTLSYKSKNVIVTSMFWNLSNEQLIDYKLDRQDTDGGFYRQQTLSTADVNQEFFETNASVKISDKSKLLLSSGLSSYSFTNAGRGFFESSEGDNENLETFSRQKNTRWDIASAFVQKIGSKGRLFIRGKYFNYDDINNFDFGDGLSNDVESSTNELTGVISYEHRGWKLFGKPTSLNTGLKVIDRDFDFLATDFSVSQRIINGFVEFDVTWSKRFSYNIAFSLDETRNQNETFRDTYLFFLPTINTVYHFNKNVDLRAGYSRKIIRPGADDLNENEIFINPGLLERGNSELDPQVRDYYFVSISKFFKRNYFSLRLFTASTDGLITNAYETSENGVLIKSLENAASYRTTGFNIAARTRLFKKIFTNLNVGLAYHEFNNPVGETLTEQNDGYTFNSNFYFGSNLFKNKLNVSFTGYFTGPVYSLISRVTTFPGMNINLRTNLFKDNLEVRFTYQDLFAINTERIERSNFDAFNQFILTSNKTTNFILTLTYFFGKDFDDRFDNYKIDNKDIIVE